MSEEEVLELCDIDGNSFAMRVTFLFLFLLFLTGWFVFYVGRQVVNAII
ncbi:MAG: hypothetical protein ABIF92_02485 [archaeon]